MADNDVERVISILGEGGEKLDGYVLPPAGPLPFPHALLHVRQEQASGVNGGTFNSGAWRTRVINTEQVNTIDDASLAANQLSLPVGLYHLWGWAGAFDVNQHQARFRDVDSGANLILGGTGFARSAGGGGSTISWLLGEFTLDVQTTCELQHRCATTQANTGFGNNAGWGVEVYSELWITKVG